MKRFLFLIIFIIIIPFLIRLLSFYTVEKNLPDDNYRQSFLKHQHSFSVEIPDKIDFSGEPVPTYIFDVRERLDRELLINVYWQSHTILMFKRAYRWFPVIEPILKQHKIPDDFKYIALIESGFMHRVSPAGAEGFWQFMKETAVKYNLEVNDEVDERYNLEKATVAACRYISNAYKKYNNWTMAAVSYNRGIAGIDRQIERQKVDNFYDMLLNEESSRYVFRILAVKIIMTNPTQYGFYLRKKDLYPPIPTKELTVDTAIADLASFAKANMINYKILKEFNPWLRENYLKNTARKTYAIKIPTDAYMKYDILLQSIPDGEMILDDSVSFDYIK